MTYSFKLARRLARLRTSAFALGAALSAACTSGDGDALSPSSNNSSEYTVLDALRGRERGRLKRIASVRVIPDTANLEPLDTTTFTALAKLTDGTSMSVKVNWSASGGTIDSTGKFTADSKLGTYRVVATTPAGTLRDTAAVTVSDTVVADTGVTVKEPVAAVLVTLASESLTVSQTTQATAKTYDASGQQLTGRTVTLLSSNNAVATVSASGLVTAVAAGTAAILARSEGQTGSADITVTAVSVKEPVASVLVTLGLASLTVNQTTQATAKTYDASGQQLTGRTVTLSSSNRAVATISASGLVTAVAAGTALILATSEGQAGSASIVVTAVASTPGTPSLCVGTPLSPADDWAAKVNAAAAGTIFCVQDGVHLKARNVVPKTGMQFIGASYLGATLDGLDTAKYAFQTLAASPANVIIKYLKITNYAPPVWSQATIQGDNGRGWVVDSNEISYSKYQGVRLGDQGKIRWNYIHHNAENGIGLYRADGVLIEGNHLAFNPPTWVDEAGATANKADMKIFASVGVVVRNNMLEDGQKKGIWFDTDNYLALIEGNTIRRQGEAGIWYEAGYDAVIRNNMVVDCGLVSTPSWVENAGIQVTNSPAVEIYGNTISGCDNGITGMSIEASTGTYYTGNRGLKPLGMNVHNNTVTQPTGKIGVRSTGTGSSVFTAGHIFWQDNTYNLTGNAGPFTWQNLTKTAAQWQALGFEINGSFTP